MHARTLTPKQVDAIVIANSRISQKNRGLLFYFDMGLGKTALTISFVSNKFKDTNVCVFSPGLQRQWKEEFGKMNITENNVQDDSLNERFLHTKYNRSDNVGNIWKMYDYTELHAFYSFRDGKGYDNVVYVFDECHLLPQTMTNDTAKLIEFFRKSHLNICLTGTLIKDSVCDLMYSIALLADDEDFKTIPLTVHGFERVYFKTNHFKALVQGWLVTILALQVGMTAVLFKILDAADFYANQNPKYFRDKKVLIQRITQLVPLFDTNVFTDSPGNIVQTLNPQRIISMMLYYTLLSPFSFVVPGICGLFIIKSKRETRTIDENKLFPMLQKYIIYGNIQYKNQTSNLRVKNLFSVPDLKREFRILVPYITTTCLSKCKGDNLAVMSINRVKVTYSAEQVKTFIHFTVGRLTETELRKLGILDKTANELHFRTKEHMPTFEDIERIGVRIGNLCYSKQENNKIKTEYEELTKDVNKRLKKWVTNITPSRAEEQKNPDIELLSGVSPKFEHVLKTLNGFKYTYKAVVYSSHIHGGLLDFYQYLLSASYDLSILKLIKPENKPLFDEQEQEQKMDSVLTAYKSSEQNTILLLDPAFIEGVDGIQETTHMFILDPLLNYSQLRQLRARVVRTNSHKEPNDKIVRYYEYACSLHFITKHLFNDEAVADWMKHDSEVFYTLRTVFFGQNTTPDEVILANQTSQQQFELNLNKYLLSEQKVELASIAIQS